MPRCPVIRSSVHSAVCNERQFGTEGPVWRGWDEFSRGIGNGPLDDPFAGARGANQCAAYLSLDAQLYRCMCIMCMPVVRRSLDPDAGAYVTLR